MRFRTLIGEAAWTRLPEAVCRRFSKCLSPEDVLVYRGNVAATELSPAGWLLAFLVRAIGSPLPLSTGATGPALVVVREDERLGGQSWTRIYARRGRAPHIVHSAKCFRGPTGLEEYVGYGIGMALNVTVEESALIFHSDHYFLTLGGGRMRLPPSVRAGPDEHRAPRSRPRHLRLPLDAHAPAPRPARAPARLFLGSLSFPDVCTSPQLQRPSLAACAGVDLTIRSLPLPARFRRGG